MTQHLPIVGYINPLVADALRDPTSGINTTQLRAEPNAGVSGAVVMKADADAEIAQVREVLRLLLADWEDCMGERPSIGSNAARKALKGPEA
ncbi:hypothetical protein NBRC3280_3422 [Acetobacter pasteurianus NBRC 3280]|uniref:Uncharacterized protein n=1 Tax=Acetobacter pasteurianus NBRC 3278 TaxID=1226660 RepID=A0A401X9E7_ACEPA|nr:hypothetical protein [Acetobacter pasteurianus]GCD60852.1 hypothetical protein NBRC3277_3427 [Acetobacter pasteurianus NBRC 3277]GCD64454.1 hypothetical protein NBRC3278_3547 [Acetobacter pasteurianus NBRC 3278]GCD70787.1 hypothetical protein NBRC3280_3422 [Acetobacter pasteurianus NBRC 3280]